MKVYKAVCDDNGSSGVTPSDGRFFTKYEIGKTLVNIKEPYFAFKTHELAQKNYRFHRILECDAVISKYKPKYMLKCYYYNFIDLFWKLVRSKKKMTFDKTLMLKGTVLCESITPLRFID